MRHTLRVLLTAVAFAGFGLGGFLLGGFLPLLWLGRAPASIKRARCQRLVSTSFRFFHWYMRVAGLIDYRPKPFAHAIPSPCVLVANHPTLVDVTAILAAHPYVCCLVKPGAYFNPLYYLLVRCCGHIPVVGDGMQAVDLACRRLAEGCDVLVFPEGTRSPLAGGLHPFRGGAFSAAKVGGVPIQPLFIDVDRPVLGSTVRWYQIPRETARIRIEPLDALNDAPSERAAVLRDRAAALLAEKLDRSRLGSPSPLARARPEGPARTETSEPSS